MSSPTGTSSTMSALKYDEWITLRPLLLDSVVGLFSSFGIVIEANGPDPADPPECADTGGRTRPLLADGVAAFIGFSGKHVSGSLAILLTRETLAAIYTAAFPGVVVIEADLWDFAREMANQMLGRFKNRMLDVGLPFDVSLPMCMVGRDLSCLQGHKATARQLDFAAPELSRESGRHIGLLCSIEIADEVVLDPLALEVSGGSGPPKRHVEEGALLLFD